MGCSSSTMTICAASMTVSRFREVWRGIDSPREVQQRLARSTASNARGSREASSTSPGTRPALDNDERDRQFDCRRRSLSQNRPIVTARRCRVCNGIVTSGLVLYCQHLDMGFVDVSRLQAIANQEDKERCQTP